MQSPTLSLLCNTSYARQRCVVVHSDSGAIPDSSTNKLYGAELVSTDVVTIQFRAGEVYVPDVTEEYACITADTIVSKRTAKVIPFRAPARRVVNHSDMLIAA